MLLAVHWRLVACDIETRYCCAGVIPATLGINVDHIILSMLPAVHRSLAVLSIERQSPCAGVMPANLAIDLGHVILSMLFAADRRLASPDIESLAVFSRSRARKRSRSAQACALYIPGAAAEVGRAKHKYSGLRCEHLVAGERDTCYSPGVDLNRHPFFPPWQWRLGRVCY